MNKEIESKAKDLREFSQRALKLRKKKDYKDILYILVDKATDYGRLCERDRIGNIMLELIDRS